jgi:hypothetical protein
MMPDHTIIRTYHDQSNPFAQISRRALQNKDLSWEARGVLSYLLSKPGDWETRFTDLVRQGPGQATRMRRILKELQTAGYVVRKRYHDKAGHWQWETLVYENPEDAASASADAPYAGLPHMVNPHVGEPHTVNLNIYKQENRTNKDLTNKEGTDHPSGTDAPDGVGSAFEIIWNKYPRRNGKRLDKVKALAAYGRMSASDRAALPAAIEHYAASGQIPRDMCRFLRNDYWREWLTPATTGDIGHGYTYEDPAAITAEINRIIAQKHVPGDGAQSIADRRRA